MRRFSRWFRNLRQSEMEKRNRQYDLDTVRIITRLPQQSVCVDVGAANGSILTKMVEKVPAGTFFAFEARPDAAQRLTENFPNATVNWMALGNRSGEVTFNIVAEYPGRSGLRRQGYPGDATVEEVTVPIDCLDNAIPPDTKVDFIKIDVEGAEYAVLQGAEEVCRNHLPLIVFEYGIAGRDSFGTSPQMIFDLLSDYGLSISHLSSWLEGLPHMERDEFETASTSHWYFIAHPKTN